VATSLVKHSSHQDGNGYPDRWRSSYNAVLLQVAFDRGYHVDGDGVLWSHTGNRMNPGPGSTGYPRFTVVTPDGSRRAVMVHRLVGLQKFGDLVFRADLEVRHLDNNKFNFRPDNIGIGTGSENQMDRPVDARKTHAIAAATTLRSLTDPEVLEMRRLHAAKVPYRVLRARFGVSKSTVSYVCTGRTYRHLPVEVAA
jgi:hypothetical protein